MQFKHVKAWFGWMEEELKDKLNLGHNPLPVQFRRSHCKICFSQLHSSDEVDSFMKVVPMGVYYNISKLQPNWLRLEPSTRQTQNQAQDCNFLFEALDPLLSIGSSFELWILFWTWHMEQIKEAFQLKKSKGAKHGIINGKHVCTN